MIVNADLTIYNRILNKETDLYEYRRTVIRGIWWFVKNERSVTDKGLVAANVYQIRIPTHAKFGGKTYVHPSEWTGAEDTWTIQADDYIVKGASDVEIEKPADLIKERTETFRVLNWGDNRFGNNPHWRVQGA